MEWCCSFGCEMVRQLWLGKDVQVCYGRSDMVSRVESRHVTVSTGVLRNVKVRQLRWATMRSDRTRYAKMSPGR